MPPNYEMINIPKDFLWGVSTSAHQIEGSPLADGAGKSVWYTFCHTPGNILNNDNFDIASDHYQRWQEDVELLKLLGIKAYRFSIPWTRIFPDGYGKINISGVAFYDKLIDALLINDIVPVVTIYHWELPIKLQCLGGWTNPEIVNWFGNYADFLFSHFSDRVKIWITLNEPHVIAFLGYLQGIFPPCMKDTWFALRVVHNLLLAHAKAVETFRIKNIPDGKIGIAVNLLAIHPATDDPQDIEAAKRYFAYQNELFLDPIYFGIYPERISKWFRNELSGIDSNELKKICPPDFIGVNYYTRLVIKNDTKGDILHCACVRQNVPRTDMDWEIYPEGLYEILMWLHNRYNQPVVYVTENGAAFKDEFDECGDISDNARIEYLKNHIKNVFKALKNGANIKGYFVWSFLDNFEWTEGYTKRFGLVYVDFKTLKRTIKKSGYWYRDFIKNHRY